jgi:diaminopimelate epimerase
MGRPHLRPQDVPVATTGTGPLVDYPLVVDGQKVPVTCVSMGNPHAVAFVTEPVKDWPLEHLGPLVERHEFFPRRVNFEIVNAVSRDTLVARVWERGAGLTMACGTGACAIAVAAWVQGRIGDYVNITLPGGTLRVEWDGSNEVWLDGPAETVFTGTWRGAALPA